MNTFQDGVFWKKQCKYCKNGRFCKYRRSIDLLQARLKVVELETSGCYGTLCFWCDYFIADEEKLKTKEINEVQA